MRYGIWSNISGGSFGNKLSLESFSLEDDIINDATGEVVGDASDEIPAAVQEAEEISAQVDQVQRTQAAVDQGEEVADIAASAAARGTPVTMEEAALVQAGVGQTLDAAGAPDEVVGEVVQGVATESSGGYSLALEGFKETLQKLWQGIKDFVARLIQGIKNAWNRLWNSTASVLKKAKKLKEKLKKKKETLKSKDAKLEKWAGWMTTLSSTEKVSFSIKGAYEDYQKYEDLSKVWKGVTEAIDKVKSFAEEYAKKDSNPSISDVSDALTKISGAAVKGGISGSSQSMQKHWVGTTNIKGTCELYPFDNFGLLSYQKGDSRDGMTLVERVNSYTVTSVKYKENFSPKPKEVKFPVNDIKFAELGNIPDHVEKVIKALEDWYNKDSKKADDNIQDIRKKVDEAIKNINEEADNVRRENIRIAQRLFVVPTQLLRGSMQVCVHAIKVSNAMVSMGNALADEYEDDKKD